MALSKKDFEGKKINCDDYTFADFFEFESDDLFEAADYFWEFISDTAKKHYMVYGQPIMSAPAAEFKVFDRYT